MVKKNDLDIIELTILMPCLNEEVNISASISDAIYFLETNNINGEILIVDNGSQDMSAKIARELGARVIIEEKKGYGNALRAGIKVAKGKYIIMGDCDTTYDFKNLMPFLNLLRNGSDFVIGNRFAGGIEKGAMPFSHKLGVPFLSFLGRLKYKTTIRDFHCGLRGFNTSIAQSLPFTTTGMEFATEIIALFIQSGASLQQVPTTLSKSNAPRTPHIRTIRDGFRHLMFMLK